jgi:class 3 adenylate cyclase
VERGFRHPAPGKADIVRRHNSNVVKTVGDGIHAAFHAPDDALRAALDMQREMAEFDRRFDTAAISMPIGLHAGSSIAVTLNERLDYYGEAVNLAARLESRGDAGGITMSRKFSRDPVVSDILRGYETRELEDRLKGFPRPVEICQIIPQAGHE